MNLVERLQERINNDKRLVLVIGDTMTDRWVHGHTAGCQDGCTKFVQQSVVDTPGGAANAHRSLTCWGPVSKLFGFADNDRPIKTRYLNGNEIVFRHDDDGPSTRGASYGWVRDMVLAAIESADAVLLTDYDKGFLRPEFIRRVSALCSQRGIPCVADCKRSPDVYPGCILKGNADYWTRHSRYMVGWPIAQIVRTSGADGPDVYMSDGTAYLSIGGELPTINCINHVGAGDCFAAHLTLALAYGFYLKDAAALAHSAGRVYVQHPHNCPPAPRAIWADLSYLDTISTSTPYTAPSRCL